MKFLQSALTALLLVAMAAVKVESTGDYQVVTYFQNVPLYLQEEMMNRTELTVAYLEQFLLNCDWVDPGEEYVPAGEENGNRALTVEDGDEEELQDEEEVIEDSSGGSMGRELFSSCPNSCSKSGSRSCRSRGCAFCGRCRRRRERKLNLVNAKYMGNNGSPASAFPLGLCQSDCDRNSECGPGLVCGQRSYGQPLPWPCTGRGLLNEDDYCVPAPTAAPTKFPTKSPTLSTLTPTKEPTTTPTRFPSKSPITTPTTLPTKSPTKPTDAPTNRPTDASSAVLTMAPTPLPSRFPTTRPTSKLTSKPTLAPVSDDVDLLAENVDEDFETFLTTAVSAYSIEQRLDRHANFYYCTLQNLTDCRIWTKILHMLSNGTTYPITGYPPE